MIKITFPVTVEATEDFYCSSCEKRESVQVTFNSTVQIGDRGKLNTTDTIFQARRALRPAGWTHKPGWSVGSDNYDMPHTVTRWYCPDCSSNQQAKTD